MPIQANIDKKGLKGIVICCTSAIIWIITELLCQPYLIFGHSLWHIGMGLGIKYCISYPFVQVSS